MRRQITPMLYMSIAVFVALVTIAATHPDTVAAKKSLDALGVSKVRLLSLIMPCRYEGGFTLYGVYFDGMIGTARAVNTVCFHMRDKSWTLSRRFGDD